MHQHTSDGNIKEKPFRVIHLEGARSRLLDLSCLSTLCLGGGASISSNSEQLHS